MPVTFRAFRGGYGASYSVASPTGTVSGDILVHVVQYNGTLTTPTGWTKLVEAAGSFSGAVYARVANGTSTDDFAGSPSIAIGASIAYSDHGCSAATDVVYATPVLTSLDPPNLSAGSSKEWMWCAWYANTAADAMTPPTGYTERVDYQGDGRTVTIAEKLATASSENPGAFTGSGGTFWSYAGTFAIPPAVAAAGLLPASYWGGDRGAQAVHRSTRW